MFHLAPHITLNTSTSSLSLLPLLCYCRPLLRTQSCCPRIQLSTVKIHGRTALLRNSTPPQNVRAQEDRAQQDSGQPKESNDWRPGWFWGNWCQTVVLQPIIDTFSLRFSRKHCDAARLGPQGTCTRSPCEYWHPPECQFFKTKSGRKAGDKCLFPHCKVEEHPSKKSAKRATILKTGRHGCCSCCENCTTFGSRLARLWAIRTSEKRDVSGKREAKSFGID